MAGAVDFLEKPFMGQELLDRIRPALEHDAQSRHRRREHASIRARLATLTAREREVLDLAVAGRHDKAIAAELGLFHKTIELQRKKIMDTMHADTVVDLV